MADTGESLANSLLHSNPLPSWQAASIPNPRTKDDDEEDWDVTLNRYKRGWHAEEVAASLLVGFISKAYHSGNSAWGFNP
jgi:hypothetical protein